MTSSPTNPPAQPKAWICVICGYIHYGDEPPDECPMCGAAREEFAPYVEEVTQAAATNRRYVVIGAGVAGVSAAEALRKTDPAGEICLISDEPGLPYYRMNLTRYLAGELRADQLALHPETWYAEQWIDLAWGRVMEIDLAGKTLLVEEKNAHRRTQPFDRLILAGGAHPFVPPIPGADLPGVTTLRTQVDAERILAACRAKTDAGERPRVVCIGGGILGLEAAGALACQGARVTVLENQPWLLARQLNPAGGAVLAEYLQKLDIHVIAQAKTRQILAGTDAGCSVALEDGQALAADVVVISAGVRSNLDLARRAGLQVNLGVVVDDGMRTSHADVYAAGDIAEFRGMLYGLWAPAQLQGAAAGKNAAGVEAVFSGPTPATTLKVLGIDLFSIGAVNDPAAQVIEEKAPGKYCAFFFKGGCLTGAILLGDARLAAKVKKAVDEKVDFSAVLEDGGGVEEVKGNL
jgi:nitrite reductase (NADH) large subunit